VEGLFFPGRSRQRALTAALAEIAMIEFPMRLSLRTCYLDRLRKNAYTALSGLRVGIISRRAAVTGGMPSPGRIMPLDAAH
jgi:hypothetical protein